MKVYCIPTYLCADCVEEMKYTVVKTENGISVIEYHCFCCNKKVKESIKSRPV